MKMRIKNMFGTISFALFLGVQMALPLAAQDKVGAYTGSRENLHVYLLIGQSNMAGKSPMNKGDKEIIPRCYLLNGEDAWEPARNPLNRYSSIKRSNARLSPGYSFSRRMLKAQSEAINLALVHNARGSTSIEEWAKGTKYYNEAVRRTKIAMKTGTLKGILWHQGERNSRDPKYLEKLEVLIQNLRKDLNAPNLPFVAGQVSKQGAPVNALIAKLPETVPATGYVSSKGITGGHHFDRAGQLLLGERYAEVMLAVQHKADK